MLSVKGYEIIYLERYSRSQNGSILGVDELLGGCDLCRRGHNCPLQGTGGEETPVLRECPGEFILQSALSLDERLLRNDQGDEFSLSEGQDHMAGPCRRGKASDESAGVHEDSRL